MKPTSLLAMKIISFAAVLSACIIASANANASILNPGFESSFESWTDIDPSAISYVPNSGSKSAKITGSGGRVEQQDVPVISNTNYRLTAYVRGAGTVGAQVSGRTFDTSTSNSNSDWQPVAVEFSSGSATSITVFGTYSGAEGRFDDFGLEELEDLGSGSSSSSSSSSYSDSCTSGSNLPVMAATDGKVCLVAWLFEWFAWLPGWLEKFPGWSEILPGCLVDGTNDGHAPENVLDGSFAAESRWSSEGIKWITLDLGTVQTVEAIDIAWYRGNQRVSFFDVETSTDNSNWTEVLSGGQSSGTTADMENYDLPDTNARYVRVTGSGNTDNDWNSILEIDVIGCADSGSSSSSVGGSSSSSSSSSTSSGGTSSGGSGGGLDPNLPPSSNFSSSGGGSSSSSSSSSTSSGGTSSGGSPSSSSSSSTSSGGTSTSSGGTSSGGSGSGLDPNLPPSSNFDLSAWKLTVPTDNNGDGKSDSIMENDLNAGYADATYFYTAADGGMVFRCPVDGDKTPNTKYTRSELREMLRRGDTSIATRFVNKNNWVFDSAPAEARAAAGGVDGVLRATLSIDHVTTTGDSGQVGRVVVGQIHANDDEPLRLYYRKLPSNSKGSVYMAHEPNGGSDSWYDMIGSRSSSASDPADGIALGEKWSYEVKVVGNTLTVTVSREGKADVVQVVDMSNSAYDVADQYHYFKAGVYNLNNTGKGSDYVQATFYALEQSHN